MGATQRDVAAAAGVSQRTVSRCFLEPENVTPAILAKVRKAARAMGYRPNAAARAMRNGRSDVIALLRDAEPKEGHVHPALLWSAQKRLQEYGFQMTLSEVPPMADGDAGAPARPAVDGMLIPCHSRTSGAVEAYSRGLAVPAVWINTSATADSVGPDNARAGREAAAHLLELGHRRIAFLDRVGRDQGAGNRHCNCGERMAGYRQAMSAAGLTPVFLKPEGANATEAAVQFCRRFRDARGRPTALVACRQHEAQAIVHVARGFGIRVPEKLSVVAFSDETLWITPPIAMLVPPWDGMGPRAVDMLVRLREDETHSAPCLMPMVFLPGATTARAPASN